ncbi:MAG: hypothetical protein IPI67_32355 [Myxococcales bacterium]|nr:hypothetical protein [Myxococcales bacterium]
MSCAATAVAISAVGLLSLGLAPACSPASLSHQQEAQDAEQRIVAVEADPGKRPGILLLQFQRDMHKTGEVFAVLDESGYRGLVRTRRQASIDCDHCPGPLIEAELVTGPGPSGTGAIAVGPVRGPLPKARLGRVDRKREPGVTWQPTVQVDLDGDGLWDLVEYERCGHSVPSGCSREVCDMFCTGVAARGAEPDPAVMHCRSLVPDLEDCAGR